MFTKPPRLKIERKIRSYYPNRTDYILHVALTRFHEVGRSTMLICMHKISHLYARRDTPALVNPRLLRKPHQTLLRKSTDGELGCNSESNGWDPKIN